MTENNNNETRDRLLALRRYFTGVCECVNGPHVDMQEDTDGDWVRWSDLAEAFGLPE